MMYWHIGERINREVLDNQRAEYGKQIVAQVAQQLQVTYGEKGFEKSSITRMMKFAKLFPDKQIVSAVSTQLQEELQVRTQFSWSVWFQAVRFRIGRLVPQSYSLDCRRVYC